MGNIFPLCSAALSCGRYSVNTLFWDQWDFWSPFFLEQGPLNAFFYQHGPHRQGLGGIVQWILATFFGWDTRIESYLCVICVGLATLGAFHFLKKRREIDVWDLSIAILFFKWSAWEGYIWTPNLAHGPLPLLYCVCLANLFQAPSSKKRAWAIGIVGGLSAFSGFTLLILPIVLGLLGKEIWTVAHRKQAVSERGPALILNSIAFFLFWIGYQSQPAADCFVFPDPRPDRYVSFIFAEMGTLLGMMGSKPAFVLYVACVCGATLTFLFAYFLWRKRKDSALVLLFSFSLAFALFSAIGRACLGCEKAMASRYLFYLIPGGLALWTSVQGNGRKIFFLALVIAECVFTPFYFRKVPSLMAARRQWTDCYLRGQSVQTCDASTGIKLYPDPHAKHFRERLEYLKSHQLSFFRCQSPIQ